MYIDLSMPVDEQTVVFPGDARPQFEPAGTFVANGFIDHVIHLNNHLGTHIDAPRHMVEGGKMLEDYRIERFICDAICIDARGQLSLGPELLDDRQLTKDSAVLFYTGAGDSYKKDSYATEYPAFSQALADRLVQTDIGMVGVDMISYDHDAPFSIHKTLLGADILLIENLVELDKVVGKQFKLYAFPVNFKLEAAPARVVAEVTV